ncbi:MAG: reverse transcriptase/maturase family protein [Thiotrichaceae bacterium]
MNLIDNVWTDITSFDNLLLAYRKARRGKQHKMNVAQFSLNLESELFTLQQELQSNTYQPADYHLFTIYERKPRVIAAANFRDRVVHHALLNIVEPLIDQRFIADSYANRKGKGVHHAVDRYQNWAKRYRYVLKMDVLQYFPSIDHILLKNKLKNYIQEVQTLDLFNKIIDTAPIIYIQPQWFSGDDLLTPAERRKGIPIGNLTSQFLANLYLDDFDHYVTKILEMPAYIRYVDDFVVLTDDKKQLHVIREEIRDYLAAQRLRLHPHKAHITYQSRSRFSRLSCFPAFRRLRNDNGHRFAQTTPTFSRLSTGKNYLGRSKFKYSKLARSRQTR